MLINRSALNNGVEILFNNDSTQWFIQPERQSYPLSFTYPHLMECFVRGLTQRLLSK